jgi:hypothetical protein
VYAPQNQKYLLEKADMATTDNYTFANDEEYQTFLSELKNEIDEETKTCTLSDTQTHFIKEMTINDVARPINIKKYIANSIVGKGSNEDKLKGLVMKFHTKGKKLFVPAIKQHHLMQVEPRFGILFLGNMINDQDLTDADLPFHGSDFVTCNPFDKDGTRERFLRDQKLVCAYTKIVHREFDLEILRSLIPIVSATPKNELALIPGHFAWEVELRKAAVQNTSGDEVEYENDIGPYMLNKFLIEPLSHVKKDAVSGFHSDGRYHLLSEILE